MDQNTNRIYELFANVFAKEPTRKLLQLCHKEENERLFKSFGIDLFSDIGHLPLDKQEELISVEYTRLFLAPSRLASPYESLQRGEERLWGESTVEVNGLYKRFGFELEKDFKETPDHLSCELAFLAELSRLELEYEEKEAKRGVLEVKRFFLNEHLLKWFPSFKDNIDKYAKLCYYKGIAGFLDIILNMESEALLKLKPSPYRREGQASPPAQAGGEGG